MRARFLVYGLGLLMCGCNMPAPDGPAGDEAASNVGQPAPPLSADGWLNGPGPNESELQGKVVVVDAWAHWCVPCARAAPEVVDTYEQYKSKGVIFLGLTGEGADANPKSQEFLDRLGITWPNGYGAMDTLQALQVQYLPTLLVIGADGDIAWRSELGGDLSEAIDAALAAAGTSPAGTAPNSGG